MKSITYIFISLVFSLILASCGTEDIPQIEVDKNIEISFVVNNYIENTISTRATNSGTIEESVINSLYVLLFDSNGTNPIRYFINSTTFTGGTWSAADKKITLNLTQAQAGAREVYIVANCADLKTNLDGITTVNEMQFVLRQTNTPWTPILTHPILMSGNTTHNFVTQGYQLNAVPLVRAIAKIQLNVTLSAKHQSVPIINNEAQYQYMFINFDMNSHVIKPSFKAGIPVQSSWIEWDVAGLISSYTLASNKVTTLSIITYINERDDKGSAIDIKLPHNISGPLPPPEFGNETFKLLLPEKIERNHWYQYEVEI